MQVFDDKLHFYFLISKARPVLVFLSAVQMAIITEMRCEIELKSRVLIADQDPVVTCADVGGSRPSFFASNLTFVFPQVLC